MGYGRAKKRWRRKGEAFGGAPFGGGREQGRLVLGAHGERSEPKSDRHQATERGGRGLSANVVPLSKQGWVANVVLSCSKQGMVANVVPSCSKQGLVVNVVPSCSKQRSMAVVGAVSFFPTVGRKETAPTTAKRLR